MNKIDIADLDCIYLTYDEPQREEFWVRIHNMVPWAKRVDGVKGSDAAHKAAAEESDTERFILIDGDNIPDAHFFDLCLTFPDAVWEQAVFRWRARNHINGLMYGNGGLSSWTRTFIRNMRTHENTDGSDKTAVEFCFDAMYWPMHDCYSTTYPNGSEKHAWRAGFREGVKMCLDQGSRLTIPQFKDRVHAKNLDNLTIWHNVGSDVEHGMWAIAGSRQGTWMTMFTDWDYKKVHCFDNLEHLWMEATEKGANEIIQSSRLPLKQQLDLPDCILSPECSRFFKHHYKSNWIRRGIMSRESTAV